MIPNYDFSKYLIYYSKDIMKNKGIMIKATIIKVKIFIADFERG